VAVTAPDEPKRRFWRSPEFVQPLLITFVGVVVSLVLYEVVLGSLDTCPGCSEFFNAIETIPVALAGLLITGLVVGLVSHDSGASLRAVLVGVMVPLLILVVGTMDVGDRGDAHEIFSALTFGAFVGLVLLVPAALGFGVGRVLGIGVGRLVRHIRV
jgi:hypothetical protein